MQLNSKSDFLPVLYVVTKLDLGLVVWVVLVAVSSFIILQLLFDVFADRMWICCVTNLQRVP